MLLLLLLLLLLLVLAVAVYAVIPIGARARFILCVILGFRFDVMRSAFFWDFTQRRLTVCYRLVGITYRAHLQASGSLTSSWTAWTLETGEIVCPVTSVKNYNLRYVKSQKSSNLEVHTLSIALAHCLYARKLGFGLYICLILSVIVYAKEWGL